MAANASDVDLAHDCQSGGCGTCRIRLIEGAVSMKNGRWR